MTRFYLNTSDTSQKGFLNKNFINIGKTYTNKQQIRRNYLITQ